MTQFLIHNSFNDSDVMEKNSSLDKILIVSHKQDKCGVYQYGVNIAEALKKSTKYSFVYAECSSPEEFFAVTSNVNPSAIIYNYYPVTLPWVIKEIMDRIKVPHICIIHEITQRVADLVSNDFFNYYIAPDPSLISNNPLVFKTSRLITNYTNTYKQPEIITIGSFGFGFKRKGFERLISSVQQEFDSAIIRLHIPASDFADPTGEEAKATAKRCQELVEKSGIRLILSHEFLSENQLLDFLAQNTLNAFFYERCEGRGISSVIDYALAVQRPIAITKSTMFRHMLSASPSICIEDSTLTQIINNGIAPLVPFANEWSEQNFIREYEHILDKVLGNHHKKKAFAVGIPNVTSLNRILDNAARSQYKPAIDKLFQLVPAMMSRKIPEANVQQAFVLDTVQKFASEFTEPKILCVGSYEDTAAAGLKQLGYQMEEIDPVLNYDLNTYFHQESTLKGNYDIIFSTSVLEHVQDDELFMTQIGELLAPGGTAILTCDYNDRYKPGDRIPKEDFRFYTQKDFTLRILPLLQNCSLVDVPQWDCPHPDFTYAGCYYTFATLVFQKNKLQSENLNQIINTPLPPLRLKNINLVALPDWSQPEASLVMELEQVIKTLVTRADKDKIALLIETSNIAEEDANLILSGVMMNLLMQEDLGDIEAGPEISLVGSLSTVQWEALLPNLSARIVLEHENQQAITSLSCANAQSKAESLPCFQLKDLDR